MKEPRFTEQQIAFLLRHADVQADSGGADPDFAELLPATGPVPDPDAIPQADVLAQAESAVQADAFLESEYFAQPDFIAHAAAAAGVDADADPTPSADSPGADIALLDVAGPDIAPVDIPAVEIPSVHIAGPDIPGEDAPDDEIPSAHISSDFIPGVFIPRAFVPSAFVPSVEIPSAYMAPGADLADADPGTDSVTSAEAEAENAAGAETGYATEADGAPAAFIGEPAIEAPTPEAQIAETYDRLRRKYSGLPAGELARVHALQDENSRLKELVAKLIVEKPPPGATGAAPPEEFEYDDDGPFTIPITAAAAIDQVKEVTTRAALKVEGALVQARETVAARSSEAGTALRATGAGIARLLRHPVSGGSAAFRAVRDRTRGRLTWAGVRDGVTSAAHSARRKTKDREMLLVAIAGGLIAGFTVGIAGSPIEENEAASLPVDMRIRLNSTSSASSMLEKGWDRPQPWGTWMSGNEASVMIGLDGPSRGDVELLVDARTQPLRGIDPPTVIVRYNSVELGRWRLPDQAGELRRRFVVPQSVFNHSTEGHISFAIPASTPAATVFGVQGLSLRDARLLTSFRGFVDMCTSEKLTGWAVAEDTPVSVVVSVNGERVKGVLSSVERSDLASHGLPTGAGFELTPQKPLAAGSNVEVRFANGRPLQGSPCKP